MQKSFTCIDTFSGAGGLSLGLNKAGFKILLSFDNDIQCINTQKKNEKYFNHKIKLMNAENNLGKKIMDITNLNKGDLDLLTGGPPCQGFSVQRIDKNIDSRNELVFRFMELVDELQPKFFLMENVPGIQGERGKKILEKAQKYISNKGYSINSTVIDAQDFGVPQRRKRVFLVGQHKSLSSIKFEFPKPNKKIKKNTVRNTIGSMPEPPVDGSEHHKFIHHRRDKLSDINLKRIKAIKEGQGRDNLPNHLLADCHKNSSSKIGHRNVYGRMSWDDVSPTITARFDSFTRGQFGHPEQDRSISLREGAMLQTFPNDFIFCGNKVDIARQIGNAVPPKLGEELGKSIIKSLRQHYGKK